MNHRDVESIKNNISNTQYEMLLAIADYNEGWLTEDQLEEKLRKILKRV